MHIKCHPQQWPLNAANKLKEGVGTPQAIATVTTIPTRQTHRSLKIFTEEPDTLIKEKPIQEEQMETYTRRQVVRIRSKSTLGHKKKV